MRERNSVRANIAACDLAKSFQDHGNSELGVLPDLMPRKADKLDLDSCPSRRSRQLEAHRLVDDPEVARKERQRLAEILCA